MPGLRAQPPEELVVGGAGMQAAGLLQKNQLILKSRGRIFVDFRLLKVWYGLLIFSQIWSTNSKKLQSLKIHNSKLFSPAGIWPLQEPREDQLSVDSFFAILSSKKNTLSLE